MAEQLPKSEEKVEDSITTPNWDLKKCIRRELLVDPSKGEEYSCRLCGLIPREASEMACDEHEDDDSDDDKSINFILFGLECVAKYLRENGDKCPLTKHENAKVERSRAIRRAISKLEVICPSNIPSPEKEEKEAERCGTLFFLSLPRG